MTSAIVIAFILGVIVGSILGGCIMIKTSNKNVVQQQENDAYFDKLHK